MVSRFQLPKLSILLGNAMSYSAELVSSPTNAAFDCYGYYLKRIELQLKICKWGR